MIVVDASAAVDWLLGIGASDQIGSRLLRRGETLHAPHLFDIEVLDALRRLTLQGKLDRTRGLEAVEDFLALDLRRYPHYPLAERIWALRQTATAFDAAYLALAEALDVPLVTADLRLGRTHGHRAQVEVYAA